MPLRAHGAPPLAVLAALATLAPFAAAPASAATLTLVEKETAGSLAGVYGLALEPGGAHLFAASFNGNSLIVYGRDPGTGELEFLVEATDGVAGVDGLRQAASVAVSPDGGSVYVAARQDDAIAIFDWDGSDGGTGLTYRGAVFDAVGGVEGLWQVRSVAVTADGAYVLASGRSDPAAPKGSLVLFERDPVTDLLTFADLFLDTDVVGGAGLGSGGRIALSPDGAHVYVASEGGSAVAIFTVDTVGDQLVYVDTVRDGVAGVDGLGGASAVALSADGAQGYVTGAADNAVAVFDRDGDTGALAFVEVHRDAVAGVDGLAGATGVAVAPAGDRVYVAGPTDDALAVFSRAGDGTLAEIEVLVDGVAAVDGLAGARAPLLSPDGSRLYVAANGEAAIGVFAIGDAYDLGDAPDPTYPTLLASDGARHVVTGALRLGAAVDAEPDGLAATAADGDDGQLIDDEDGVIFLGALVPGQPAAAEVTASAAGELDAWIDFDTDGDWDDAGERIASGFDLVAGANAVPLTVPASTPPNAQLVARFRASSAGVAGPTGLALDGEVEDYLVQSTAGADLAVTKETPAQSIDWLQSITYTITVSNGGPNGVDGAQVTDLLPATLMDGQWTCAASGLGSCTPAGSGDIQDLALSLPAGESAVYTLTATVVDQAPGPAVVNTATVVAPGTVVDPVASNDSDTVETPITPIFSDDFETGLFDRWDSFTP